MAPVLDRTAIGRWTNGQRLIILAASLFFAVVVLRTAWISDDAYITFRTIDNVLHGWGARWNVAERVQAYTHPLWMMLLTAVELITREPYFTALAISLALSVGTVWLLATRLAFSAWSAVLGVVLLTSSRAFVDFSTSGLENPLAHFLIVAFIVSLTSPLGRRPMVLASLVMLCRQDLVCLVGPALLLHLAREKSSRSARSLLIGFSPLIAWEIWSLVYYGFPVPNTLFAKLSTSIPKPDLVVQGMHYLEESWLHDPLTLTVVGASVVVGFLRGGMPRALAIGQLAYLSYVVWIGGDFMSGRFVTAPFVVGVVQLASAQFHIRVRHVAIVALMVAVEMSMTRTGSMSTGLPEPYREFHGITNERAYYYPRTGLLRTTRPFRTPELVDAGLAAEMRAAGQTVATREMVGMFAYAAGPDLYVVDRFGLGDPLLARLPVTGPWRIGHFPRELPDGYIQTLRSGTNQIADPGLREYYESLTRITRGPIWSAARWRSIAKMNLGLGRRFP